MILKLRLMMELTDADVVRYVRFLRNGMVRDGEAGGAEARI